MSLHWRPGGVGSEGTSWKKGRGRCAGLSHRVREEESVKVMT